MLGTVWIMRGLGVPIKGPSGFRKPSELCFPP